MVMIVVVMVLIVVMMMVMMVMMVVMMVMMTVIMVPSPFKNVSDLRGPSFASQRGKQGQHGVGK